MNGWSESGKFVFRLGFVLPAGLVFGAGVQCSSLPNWSSSFRFTRSSIMASAASPDDAGLPRASISGQGCLLPFVGLNRFRTGIHRSVWM